MIFHKVQAAVIPATPPPMIRTSHFNVFIFFTFQEYPDPQVEILLRDPACYDQMSLPGS